jgi:hypothetical protein
MDAAAVSGGWGMFTTLVRRLWPLVPAFSLCGCTWLPYAARNTSTSFANVFHEYRFQCDIRRLAEAAWKEICYTDLTQGKGGEFGNGFRAGFTDYLDANGKGNPPAVPPYHLRTPILRSPQQSQDIADWNAGFRLGAEVASQSRWRDQIVVPISLPPQPNTSGYHQEIIPPPGAPARDQGIPGVATFETSDLDNDNEANREGENRQE